MAKHGLAPDRMTTERLWTRVAGHLTTLHLMERNRDPLAARLLRIEELQAMVTELRHRGEQLPLVPQHSGDLTEEEEQRVWEAWHRTGPLERQESE